MASAYGTVKDHHGAITVSSEVQVGTTFTIILPVREEDVEVTKEPQLLEHGTGRILLVDDEKNMRITGKGILQDLGYDVLLAEDGKRALEIFQEQDSIDLVLLDMIMPNMNGQDCFDELKKRDPGVRVILTSGFTREESIDEMKERGLSGFIRKPFRSSELSHMVNNVLKN